jgi:hypothetical protein
LPELTLTGVGLIPRVGSGDAALPGITTGTFGAFASGGATAVIGAGSLRLPGLAAAGVGDADVEETPGTGDLVFADMALNGSGVAFDDDERDADPIDLSFPGLVLTSLGAVANPPNADPALVLPVLEVAADGTVSPNRAGDGPLALPGLELAADGEVETPATAEGELDLPGLTTASVALAGISPEATDQDLPLPALLASGLGAFVPLPTAEDENLILPALTAGGFGISRTFDFDVYGRRPISVDQWHGAQNYPFVEAQPDAVVGDLVADAFLLLPAEESCSFPYPYQIAWMSGFGTAMIARPEGVPVPTHPYDVGITDSEDNVVFDSTLAGTTYKSAPWGNRLLVSEWLQEDRVLRIVHHIAWENDEDVVEYPLYIVPTGSTVLDIRTIHFQPNRPAEILVGGNDPSRQPL